MSPVGRLLSQTSLKAPFHWEAQVDFGTGAPVIGKDRKKRRTHVLRVVLSHSRKGYAEVVFRQTTDEFLQALENAFWHFGGVPKTVVIDNLRVAVKNPDWYDPDPQRRGGLLPQYL
jgi:transposase